MGRGRGRGGERDKGETGEGERKLAAAGKLRWPFNMEVN